MGTLLCTTVAYLAEGRGDLGAVAFAVGESCYLGAATVLLVLGRERALLHGLLPMTADALFTLVQRVPDWSRLTLPAGSLAPIVVLAAHEVAPAVRESGTTSRTAGLAGGPTEKDPASPWLSASLPYALFGLGTGVLVLYAARGDVITGAERSAVATRAAVALTLSMGVAEWLLYRFRSGALAGLRSTSTPGASWRATSVTLVQCLAGYLAALLVLAHATAAMWLDAPDFDGVRLAGMLLLGAVLWTGLLLQSFGAFPVAAAVCCATALAQTLAPATYPGDPHGVGPLVCGVAARRAWSTACWGGRRLTDDSEEDSTPGGGVGRHLRPHLPPLPVGSLLRAPSDRPAEWQALVAAAPRLYGVVLNPADGPGAPRPGVHPGRGPAAGGRRTTPWLHRHRLRAQTRQGRRTGADPVPRLVRHPRHVPRPSGRGTGRVRLLPAARGGRLGRGCAIWCTGCRRTPTSAASPDPGCLRALRGARRGGSSVGCGAAAAGVGSGAFW